MYPGNKILVLLLVACAGATATVNKTQLYFSYITTKTGDQFITSGGTPAVDLALEEINSNSSILANYKLNYTTVLDSKVSLFTKLLTCIVDYLLYRRVAACMHGPMYIRVQCTSSSALDAFFQHFKNASQETYVSLVCCGCSEATIAVAEVSHYWNIAHVSSA